MVSRLHAGAYVSTSHVLFFFFFQAEDGIRDLTVTGVQTCALPILLRSWVPLSLISRFSRWGAGVSIGLIFDAKVRMTAERTVSSTREKFGCSACQQASTRSA